MIGSDTQSPSSSNSSRADSGHHDSELCQTIEIPVIHGFQIDNLNSIQIGRGSYGHVEKTKYRISRDYEYRIAAVKYANDKDHLLSLIREAKVLMNLQSHPNIIKIYGLYNCPRNGTGVVMEYMDCHSMAELIHNRNIDYSIDHFASWMFQLSSAVEFFHSHNQVHRDLKVQNMLLSNRYRTMKICDFGTYTAVRASMTFNRGTPVTMAPEIFQCQKYNMKCDMFSIGIIMWQILARREPYLDHIESISLLYSVAIANKRPPELECSYILSGFYKRCWHQNPEKRPTSKEALEYFKLLRQEYPKGDEPLFDKSTDKPARTPKPICEQENCKSPLSNLSNLREPKRTHRRTGSDQTTLRLPAPTTSLVYDTPAIRGTRSRSVASNLLNSINDSHSSSLSIAQLWDKNPELRPAEPDVRNPQSLEIYNNHCYLGQELIEFQELEKDVLAVKHDTIEKWKILAYKKDLNDRIEYLNELIKNMEMME